MKAVCGPEGLPKEQSTQGKNDSPTESGGCEIEAVL